MGYSRKRNAIEEHEAQIQRRKQKEAGPNQQCSFPLYRETLVAKNYQMAFLRAMMNILDFSSIPSESPLLYFLKRDNPFNLFLVGILSTIRKNKSLYYKDEALSKKDCHNNTANILCKFYACSPKQYLISFHNDDIKYYSKQPERFLFDAHSECSAECEVDLDAVSSPLVLKAKGLKRSIQGKVLNNREFQKVAQRQCPAKRVAQHTIKRQYRRAFLVFSNRRSLSNLNTKQYFSQKYRNHRIYVGFPLFLKDVLES